MEKYLSFQLVAAAVVALLCSGALAFHVLEGERGSLPQMPFYHRFSQQMRENTEKSGANWPFPALNTPEYYQLLVHRDLVRHGRKLATAPKGSLLTFYMGNLTDISSDGLHYALVDVGTPKVSYFVALDTGSDLFWLPCECKACAPISSPDFQGLPSLNVYAPSKSSTSQTVPCASSNCSTDFSTCSNQNIPSSGQCAYEVVYGAANTSSSGTLYQDDIHLTLNDGPSTDITSPILLGCGQTQTGSLVDGSSVPDGLLGLGLQSFSVPSVLAQSGLVGDSFSICFSLDGSGRIVFGDFGSSNQTTTSFQVDTGSEFSSYEVAVDSITVGTDSIPVNEDSLFDTGTSIAYLSSAVYKAVIDSFSKQTTEYRKVVFDGVFDLCYQTSEENVDVPSMDFVLGGEAKFSLVSPYAPYYYQNNTLAGFCLAVLDGGSTSIFGVNFMIGYDLVFNREASTLSFAQSACYGAGPSDTTVSPTVSPALAPTPTPGSSNGSPPKPGSGGPTTSPSGREGNSGQRMSVSLFHIFSLGLLAHLLLISGNQI